MFQLKRIEAVQVSSSIHSCTALSQVASELHKTSLVTTGIQMLYSHEAKCYRLTQECGVALSSFTETMIKVAFVTFSGQWRFASPHL